MFFWDRCLKNIEIQNFILRIITIINKSSKDRTWSAVPDALLGVIAEKVV